MAAAVIYKVDLFRFYETGDIDAVCCFHRYFVEIIFLKNDKLVFTVFITPYCLLGAEVFIVFGTIEYLFGTGKAFLMEVVKAWCFTLGSYGHSYGDSHHSKTDYPFPERSGHSIPLY
jgi:hypothetical protein